jgi:dTDP-4-amino-4,6-dideoxygalactose transaminase
LSGVVVPLLDLTAQYAPIRTEILDAITRVCDSQRFIMGPEVEALEREMAAAIGIDHAIAVSSGTDAILSVLMALGIGPGDEVITPTYSFFATAGCVSRVGGTPVFVDVDPVTLNVDPDAISRAITGRTRATCRCIFTASARTWIASCRSVATRACR